MTKRALLFVLLFATLLAQGVLGGGRVYGQPVATGIPTMDDGEAAEPDTGPDPTDGVAAPAPQPWFEPSWLLTEQDGNNSALGSSLAVSDGATGLSAPTTEGDWQNGWALACILPLGAALNFALGASMAAPPPFDLSPSLAEYSANLALKLCAPAVYAPSDFSVPANKELNSCGYTFEQDLTRGDYQNFYGITLPWGDIFPGKDWGDFNQPLVIHWNTDVDVRLRNPDWTRLIDLPLGPGQASANQYWLPSGRHNLVWRGDTLVSAWDFVFFYIPGGAWTKLAKITKLKALEKNAVQEGIELGLDLFVGELFPQYPSGMFNEEVQRVAVTDTSAPTVYVPSPQTAVEAIEPGGLSKSTYMYLLRRDVTVTDNCDADPELRANNNASLPEFAPVGATFTVDWVAEDRGPVNLDGGTNTSAVVQQTFTVTDTLAPIILAPPDIVTETVALPAALHLGNPATFDLADLNPGVAHDACDRPDVVCEAGGLVRFPAGVTEVTWTATDHVGNASTATQLVNVKAVGTNNRPLAHSQGGGQALDAISFEPLTLTLTAADPDADPLWFKVQDQPQDGFFHAPLYPYFIQDYRLANLQEISFGAYCQEPANRQKYVPTNWPVEANFMAVADDGTTYVHDHGMIQCASDGSVSQQYRIAVFRPDGSWEQLASSFEVKDFFVDLRRGYVFVTSHNVGGTYDFVRQYDLELNLLNAYRMDYADQPISEPKQGLVDEQGIIYVTDGFIYQGVAKLWLYDANPGGNPIFLADYSLPGVVWNDLALDSQGNLYASAGKQTGNSGINRVYQFSPATLDEEGNFTPGQLIGWLGRCDSGPGCDVANQRSFGYSCLDDTLTAQPTCGVSGDNFGSGPGQFHSPRGIAVAPNDILYVTDYYNQRVQRFTPDGYFAGQAVSECDGSCFVLGDFGKPKQVTVNSSRFYVLDDEKDLLHVFETTPLTRIDSATAEIVYQSDNNFVGTERFTFTAADGLATSDPATVEINVTRNYRPPIANPQAPLTITEDTVLPLPFSGYDPDEPLDTLSFQTATLPENGTVSGATPDMVYTPDQDYNGVDTFTFVASDGLLLSGPQPVTVTVTPVNDPPSFPEDGSTPPSFAYRLAGATVALSRLAPLGTLDEPLQVGRGFSTVFNVTYYDPDDGDTHAVTVDWGDGSPVEPEGELLEDGTITGPLLAEGQAGGTGTVTAEHTYSQNGDYTVQVCVSDNVDVDEEGNKSLTAASETRCKSIPVQVSATTDLLLDIRGSSNPFPIGGDLSYELTLINNAPETGPGLTATGLLITDTLDWRLSYSAAHSDQGTCSRAEGQITCDLAPLAPGETATVTVEVDVAGSLTAGTTLVNRASYHLNEPDQSDRKSAIELTTLVEPADFIVTAIDDAGDDDVGDNVCATAQGACTLRAAVEQANASLGVNSIAMADWQFTLGSALTISDDLTITGLGAGETILVGNGNARLVTVLGDAVVTMADLTLQGGYEDVADGGALSIAADADVILRRVQLSGNHAAARGGAIFNLGALTMYDSAVTGNDADGGPGGIGSVGTLALYNTTVSGNRGQTGGIGSTGAAMLVNVTVARNHATGSGGGLNGGPDNFTLKNTILAGNTAEIAGPNCGYGFTSQGYNLIDNLRDCTVLGATATNIVGQDPLLLTLDLNGGATLSQAPQGASPAVDAGGCDLAADQRGVPRPTDGDLDGVPACDIGAVELVPEMLFLPVTIRN